MAGVEWSDNARISIRTIGAYIASECGRPEIADRLIDAIYDKGESYARQPEMGSLHEDLPDEFRYFVHKRYVIVYETLDDGIMVHLVIDSARNWTRMFD